MASFATDDGEPRQVRRDGPTFRPLGAPIKPLAAHQRPLEPPIVVSRTLDGAIAVLSSANARESHSNLDSLVHRIARTRPHHVRKLCKSHDRQQTGFMPEQSSAQLHPDPKLLRSSSLACRPPTASCSRLRLLVPQRRIVHRFRGRCNGGLPNRLWWRSL